MDEGYAVPLLVWMIALQCSRAELKDLCILGGIWPQAEMFWRVHSLKAGQPASRLSELCLGCDKTQDKRLQHAEAIEVTSRNP
jgi:hypothetical protein